VYTSFIRACLILFVFILSVSAHAAGLGKLTINSALGQPFDAEIDLVTVDSEDLSSLIANIASLEAYAQAGLQYDPYFSTFRLSIEPRANGAPYIKIASPQAVNEPFLNLLIELNWASGRLLREYTVLLDPVDTKRPEPVAPIVRTVTEESTNPTSLADTVETETASTVAQSTAVMPFEQPQQTIPAPASRLSGNQSTDATYGPVLQGDTLSSIARQVKPEGVNVNQMLVALFRANREAFIADNMNLLRTGVVLKIPGIEESSTITRQQADAEVKLQVSNWQNYRQNLARTAQQSQEQTALKQVDSGQITTTLDDTAKSSRENPQEVLRLSGGEYMSDSADARSGENTLQRLRMMEEDAIARSMALKEANERIALLEKNINNLQTLLSLQNSELAKAQTNAQNQLQSSAAVESSVTQQDSSTQAEIESIEVLTHESDTTYYSEYDLLSELADEGLEFEELSPSASTEYAASNIAAAPLENALPAAANPFMHSESSVDEPSFLEDITSLSTDNVIYLGAALILLPLLWLAFRMRNRNNENETLAEEARLEENAVALRNKAAAAVAAVHVDNSEADNSEDEFRAFDRESEFLQDERVKDRPEASESEMDNQPEAVEDTSAAGRSMALDFSKEIDSYRAESSSQASNDTADFDLSESIAHESISNQSFDEVDENDAVEESLEIQQTKDADIDDRLLDFPEKESYQSDDESTIALDTDFETPTESTDDNRTAEIEALEIDLADDSVTSDSSADLSAETMHKDNMENSLEFSIDPSAIDLSDENVSQDQSSSSGSATDEDTSMLDLHDSNTLQFEAKESESGDNPAEKSAEIDFSGIDLDLENNTAETQSTGIKEEYASTDADAKNEQWHEVETKIDLARAYLDMEDKEGAREMLEEVIQEGDSGQKETAKALLKDL
jgi:pilus assembly protein FimV